MPEEYATSIGRLKFQDGLPDDETVQLVYENLDRSRATDAFLDMVPLASPLAEVFFDSPHLSLWRSCFCVTQQLTTTHTQHLVSGSTRSSLAGLVAMVGA